MLVFSSEEGVIILNLAKLRNVGIPTQCFVTQALFETIFKFGCIA